MPRFRGREITHRAPRPPRFGAPWWLGTCLEQRVRGLARRGAGGLESSSISGVRNSEANTPTCACDARAARRCMLPPGNRFRCPGRDNRQCSCRLPRPSMATFSCRPVLPSSMHLSSRCTGAAKTSPKGGVVRVSASGATTTSDKASQKKKHNAADPRKVVILGGGIQGTATAYFLSLRGVPSTIVERVSLAAAASGKAGGFLSLIHI